MLVGSHPHLFLEELVEDLLLVTECARVVGVTYIFTPNIDSATVELMLSVCDTYRDFCPPVIGLHPTSVNDLYEKELEIVANYLTISERFVAVGEIGIDLYWDKTWLEEQSIVFEKQVQRAFQYQLSIVIYCREAFDYIYKVLQPYKSSGLTDTLHSFTGTSEEAARTMELSGFKIGINGVVTFEKSTLPEALKHIPLERIVLETDSPYLTPVLSRGKRNENVDVKGTLIKVAEIYEEDPKKAAELTVIGALRVFGIFK